MREHHRSSVTRSGLMALLLAIGLAGPGALPAAAADVGVEVGDFYFGPQEQFVNAGDTVTWTWVGEAPHNVTPVEEGAFEASETITEGTHQVTFAEVGEVPYFCTLHASPDGSEGMVGQITVLPAGEPLPEPAPEPRPAPEPGRLPAAADAVGEALVWSSLFADGSAPTVALGRDDGFADSLTSGAVQGLVDGPLLLTPTGELDPRVADELGRLGATTVIILGGEEAVSADVEAALVARDLTVQRISGTNRVETAVATAQTLFPDATEVFVVRADAPEGGDPTQAFADSLAVGGAAATTGMPILLSDTDGLSEATATWLAASDVEVAHLIGGPAALSPVVEDDLRALGIEPQRTAGDTRFDTALAVANTFYTRIDATLIVEGQAPDAWVSGFAAASSAESAPILLANGPMLPKPTIEPLIFDTPFVCGPSVDPAACDQGDIAASASGFGGEGNLLAVLDGQEEVPGPGAEASGDFFLYPTSAPDAFCYESSVYGLDEPVVASHIHTGARGEAGPVLIPLGVSGGNGFQAGCEFGVDPAAVAAVLADPAGHYVNYHTASFPAGAIRGQLFTAGVIGFAELSADAEVPPSGAEGGGFTALVADLDDMSRIAHYSFYFLADGPATAAHVHEGGPDENGPVVFPLTVPTFGSAEECCEGTYLVEDIDPAVTQRLLDSPGDFYVNFHAEAHPDGAIRGQLFNPFAGPPPGSEGEPPAGGEGEAPAEGSAADPTPTFAWR